MSATAAGFREDARDAELVGLAYQAAGGAVPWDRFLDALRRRCSAHAATLFDYDYVDSATRFIGAVGIDRSMLVSYAAHYGSSNLWVLAQRNSVSGSVVLSQDLASLEQLRRNECFNHWHRPQEFDFAIGSNIEVTARSTLKLGVLRGEVEGPMGAEQKALFECLMPHLQHAMRLANSRDECAARLQALQLACEDSATAVLTLAVTGRVVDLNAAAQRILDRADGLRLGPAGRVELGTPEGQRSFQRLLHQALAGQFGPDSVVGMPVARASGGKNYFVEVQRLSSPPADPMRSEAAAVFVMLIRDPQARRAIRESVLEQTLHLTPAEARLTARLADGLELREAAKALGIAESTARFVLKHVLAKTGCHRQVELLRMVYGLSG
jgi:DNA-binding CsgD family transcriptional regulator/PAS domain-containing protein